jgi:hypothetical protein
MQVLRRSQWLARLAATVTAGIAGVAAVPAPSQGAQARVTGMVIQSHVVSSWGINTGSQLGDGTTAPTRWQPADIRAGNEVTAARPDGARRSRWPG